MAQSILEFFMESPGDRKRREAREKHDLAMVEKQFSAARDDQDVQRNKRITELAALAMEKGIAPERAMDYAAMQLREIENARDLASSAIEQARGDEAKGYRPFASRIGEEKGKTELGSLKAEQVRNLANTAIEAVRRVNEPIKASRQYGADIADLDTRRKTQFATRDLAPGAARRALEAADTSSALQRARNEAQIGLLPIEDKIAQQEAANALEFAQGQDVAGKLAAESARNAAQERYPLGVQTPPFDPLFGMPIGQGTIRRYNEGLLEADNGVETPPGATSPDTSAVPLRRPLRQSRKYKPSNVILPLGR